MEAKEDEDGDKEGTVPVVVGGRTEDVTRRAASASSAQRRPRLGLYGLGGLHMHNSVAFSCMV